MAEATSPLADPARRGPGTYRYVAHVKKDFAAAALSSAQQERAKTYKDMDLSADVWTVEKVYND